MVKLGLAVIFGMGLYVSLSYYQPIVESAEATKQVQAASNERFKFVSPIPFDLIVTDS